MNDLEFDNPSLNTPKANIHKLLLEQGHEKALFRLLGKEEQAQDHEVLVDLGLALVAVHRERVEAIREELLTLLRQFPRLNPGHLPAFGEGPSYIEVGAILGDQRTALALFAIGEALGFWQVVTPKKMLGDLVDDELAREMMGFGYITIERINSEQ